MHDTLDYMQLDPIHRRWHHDSMTFGMVYAWSEHFILPLSHDEVVYGKRSLLSRMPGDAWQRFANLRAYLAFMWAHPGKKLIFMGGEFAQPGEWSHDAALPWHLLDDSRHRGVQRLVGDLNALLRATPALYRADTSPDGFRWVIGDDRSQSVYAWLRLAEGAAPLLMVANLTPEPSTATGLAHACRRLVARGAEHRCHRLYGGGGGMGNGGRALAEPISPPHDQPASASMTLPPLATLFLIPEV